MNKIKKYEMPLGDHLEELRWRLLRILICVASGFLVAFLFFTSQLLELALYPVRSYSYILGRKPEIGVIITLKVLDRFLISMFISLIAALVLAVPYSLFEFWRFISPALIPKEKKVLFRYIPFIFLMFLTGIAFGYFIVLPVSIDFLVNFGENSLDPVGVQSNITLASYLNYFFIMTFFLGVIFQVPILMMFIVKFTDVEPSFFRKYRRHFIVLSFIFSMFLTPPDVFTQFMLALPMILLYEFGILLTKIVFKAKTIKEQNLNNQQDKPEPIIDFEENDENRFNKDYKPKTTLQNKEQDINIQNNIIISNDNFSSEGTSKTSEQPPEPEQFITILEQKLDIQKASTGVEHPSSSLSFIENIIQNKNVKSFSQDEIADIITIIEEYYDNYLSNQ